EVIFNGLADVGGASIVKEEDPLTDAPHRRGAELVGSSRALDNVVRQSRSHVMHQEVRVQVRLYMVHRSNGRTWSGERSGVAHIAANVVELRLAVGGGSRRSHGHRRRQEAHE